jgi:hypothetical protein
LAASRLVGDVQALADLRVVLVVMAVGAARFAGVVLFFLATAHSESPGWDT